MDTIINYIRWRGDLSMSERAFNEVDNIILSTIVYIDFSIIGERISEGNRMKLSEAVLSLLRSGYTSKCIMNIDEDFVRRIGSSIRFGNIYISEYKDVHDEKRNCQFAAMKYDLEDGTSYIAFRGTDKTIVGWRENFTMSFTNTEAQLASVKYLNGLLSRNDTFCRVGGHSKGGNLAVYACVYCAEEYKERIISIYDNDGPGFCTDIMSKDKLRRLEHLIQRFVPEYCVIGELFEQNIPCRIVRSKEHGINQHDPLSWSVDEEGFVLCNELHPGAKHVNLVIKQWIEQESFENRKLFVSQLFDALEVTGAKEIEKAADGLNSIEKMMIEMVCAEKETKKVFFNLVKTGAKSLKKIDFLELIKRQQAIGGIILIMFGLYLLILPGDGFRIITTSVVFAISVYMIVRILYYFRDRTMLRSKKIMICLFYLKVLLVISMLAYHTDILKLSINYLFGSVVFAFGIIKLFKLRRVQKNRNIRILFGIQSILSILLGIAVLKVPYYDFSSYIGIIGAYSISMGFLEILSEAFSGIQ